MFATTLSIGEEGAVAPARRRSGVVVIVFPRDLSEQIENAQQ